MRTYIWVCMGSGNGLLPDGTKPLSEPVLTYHQSVLSHSPESNLTRSAHELNPYHVFRGYTFKITTTSLSGQWVNHSRLGHSDTIWQHRSASTLAQVMACCLMAPSHYLNQCWLLINEVLWHSSESNSTANAKVTSLCDEFEDYTFKISATSTSGQWVNTYFLKFYHERWTCGSVSWTCHSHCL